MGATSDLGQPFRPRQKQHIHTPRLYTLKIQVRCPEYTVQIFGLSVYDSELIATEAFNEKHSLLFMSFMQLLFVIRYVYENKYITNLPQSNIKKVQKNILTPNASLLIFLCVAATLDSV